MCTSQRVCLQTSISFSLAHINSLAAGMMNRFCHQNLKPRYNRFVRAALSSSAHFKNAGGALNLDRELILYGSKKQTPVSLKSLLETGKGDLLKGFEGKQRESTTASELVLFQVACFLHRELPVRVAHRVEHLQSAPFLLNSRKFLPIIDFIELKPL